MLYNSVMEDPRFIEKKFSILQEISNAIVATDNITAIANLMLDLAVNYTNAEKGSLMLINERDELYILAARGIDLELIRTYRVKVGEGIAGTVALNRSAVLVEDIDKDERFKGKTRDRYKTRSFISCPLVSKNRLHGVLNINDKRDSTPFTEDEFTLIKIIANQAAITLENAFLMIQLKAKAAELEEINRKLIDTDIVKTEFITRVSHELRTPLNSIKGAIYYLQQYEKLTASEQKEFYEIISSETSNLISSIENLLKFLRIEDETRVIKKSIINLPDILREQLSSKSLKTSLTRKGIEVKTDIKEGISTIVGDKARIAQFVINLIEGLSYYLESGDTIAIAVSEDDFINLNITLSRRLPAAVLPHLINSRQLFQAEQPEEHLKLYLARKVAEFHRWNLEAKNTDDKFLLTLTIPKSARDKVEAVINATMGMFTEFISELLGLDICSIMLSDELTGELLIKGARGLDEEIINRTRLRFGDSIAGWVALEGKPLLIENIESDPRFARKNIPYYNTKSLISLPLKIKDKVIGVVNLNNKKSGDLFTKQDLDIASSVSERVAHFIESLYSGEYREEDFRRFISTFDSLLSAEMKYPKKKGIYPELMTGILDRLGAKEEDKKQALYISLIYDLGLVLIDESILAKKRLQPSDVRTLKVHPHSTIGLLNNFEFSESVKKAILHHHERYDGTGYPEGLAGEEIPFISRVLAVVDAFCAMIVDRPYRKALTKAEALEEIREGAGSIYDPRVVEALDEVVKSL